MCILAVSMFVEVIHTLLNYEISRRAQHVVVSSKTNIGKKMSGTPEVQHWMYIISHIVSKLLSMLLVQ